MAFGGGGFFGSGAKQDSGNIDTDSTQTAFNVDQAAANLALFSNTPVNIDVSGKKNKGNISVVTTDFGSVRSAFALGDSAIDLALQSTNDALEFGAGAFKEGVDLVSQNVNNVLAYSAGAFEAGADLVGTNVNNVLAYSAGATNKVIDSLGQLVDANTQNVDSSYEFSAGVILEANSLIDKARQSADFARSEANAAISGAYRENLKAYQENTGNAFTFVGGAFSSALDSVEENALATQELLTSFTEKTIKTAVESTKTESAQALDKIIGLTGDSQKNILYAGIGLAALFGLLALRG